MKNGPRCPKWPQIEANIEKVVQFDERFRAAVAARDPGSLHALATWATEHKLSLASKAHSAALELGG